MKFDQEQIDRECAKLARVYGAVCQCNDCMSLQSESIPDNAHYKVGSIDPCQYVEAMGTAEFRGACVLNILKYITRYPYKGTPLMDLAKAQDYLSKLIEHEKKKATSSTQEEGIRR